MSDASREKVIPEEWGMIGKSPATSHFFFDFGDTQVPNILRAGNEIGYVII